MHDCKIVSTCILSGDGGWQVRDVDVEEKRFQERSLSDAVLESFIKKLLMEYNQYKQKKEKIMSCNLCVKWDVHRKE